MEETFNVGNPEKDNIIHAFKNLIFYVSASIQLQIYEDYKDYFKKVLNKINDILSIYINNEKLSLIKEEELQDIKYNLIDLDVETKSLNSYYAEWSLLWIDAIISLRIIELKNEGNENGR